MNQKMLLPFRPKLSEGECLTSLLLRLADCLSCSTGDLLKYLDYHPTRYGPKSPDFELGAPEDFLRRLASVTGNDFNAVRKGICNEFRSTASSASWTMWPARYKPGAARPKYVKEVRSVKGLQYCPNCLTSPSFRLPLQWRFSFVTICSIHRRILASQCPNCDQDIDFSLKRGKRKFSRGLFGHHVCRYCNANLAQENRPSNPSFSRKQIDYLSALQQLHLTLLERGVDTEDKTIESYFTLLEWLINRNFPQRRITAQYAVPLGQFLAFAAHVEPLVLPRLIPQGRHTFRTYSAEDRAKLLLMTSTLLDPWPTQLIQLQKNSYFGFENIPWQAWSRPEYFRQPEASRPFGLEKNQFGSSLAHYILHSSGPRIVKDRSKQWEQLRWTRDPIDLSQSANQPKSGF